MSIHEKLVGNGDQAVLRDGRESCVHDDLARRLKGTCAALGSADFEALLDKMTIEQLRGERYRRA